MTPRRRARVRALLAGMLVALGAALLLAWALPRPMERAEKKGPTEFQFAIHRVDMALFGTLLVLGVAAVPERARRKRRGFLRHLRRALGLRIALVILGGAVLKSVAAFSSADYWDHSTLSTMFHLLGPARMAGRECLVISGLALCYTSEVVNTVLLQALGEVPKIYLLLTVDALVLAWMSMAVERGLAPIRIAVVVGQIGFTVALTSIPLALYGGLIGFWGVEPFAWFFSVMALGVLISMAYRK